MAILLIVLACFAVCGTGCGSTNGDAVDPDTPPDTEAQAARAAADELRMDAQIVLSRLGGIGEATEVYVAKHNNQLPGSEFVDDALLDNRVSAKTFDKLIPYLGAVEFIVAPKNALNVPSMEEFLAWSEARRIDWIEENSAFIFVTRSHYSVLNPDKVILVFTRYSLPDGSALGILWADGHKTREPMERARQIIKDQTGRSLEEWSN